MTEPTEDTKVQRLLEKLSFSSDPFLGIEIYDTIKRLAQDKDEAEIRSLNNHVKLVKQLDYTGTLRKRIEELEERIATEGEEAYQDGYQAALRENEL